MNWFEQIKRHQAELDEMVDSLRCAALYAAFAVAVIYLVMWATV